MHASYKKIINLRVSEKVALETERYKNTLFHEGTLHININTKKMIPNDCTEDLKNNEKLFQMLQNNKADKQLRCSRSAKDSKSIAAEFCGLSSLQRDIKM